MRAAEARVGEERASETRTLPKPESPIGARPISSIVIGKRHRHDMGDVDALAASMARIGLLHPIVVTPEGLLVCGERVRCGERGFVKDCERPPPAPRDQDIIAAVCS